MSKTKQIEDKFFDGKSEIFVDTWMNGGFHELKQKQLTFDDIIATPNASYFMPKVVESVLREPVEPLTIIPSLLDNVRHNGAARITFPAIGALVAYDMGEDQAYKEQSLNLAPGSITVHMGKTGLAFKITEEMRRYSQFDIINMHLRAGARALARKKEKKGFDYLSSMGVVIFDNLSPSDSVYGVCTGRAITGAGNGSCRMEDLIKAYAQIMMQGFVPDILLMHPLTWSMWMADPLLQTIVKNTGNGSFFQRSTVPRTGSPWASASQSKMGIPGGAFQYTPAGNNASATPTAKTSLDPTLTAGPTVPSYFPYPLRVIVSPFAPFHVHNNTCDIMIADSKELGALVVDEEVVTESWDDMAVDAMKIKMRERYTYAIYNDGLGIGVIKNVPIKANEIALPLQATISSAGSLDEISPTTAISL